MKSFKGAAALAAAMILMLFAGAASAAETTLRITLQLPMKSHLGQNLLVFQEEVENASDGDIEVEIYHSAQLYKDDEVPEAVGSGQIEMGVASLTRYVGEIPAVDVFYMPFLFNTEELVREATSPGSPVRQPIDDAILDTGSRVLWWQAYGGNVLLSKGEPLKGPEDMKNKKARVYGKTLGEWVEVLGGAPTLISGSEQYLAYQRGTVDIGMTGASGIQARNLWEVMDTVTITRNADIEFIVVVNESFWQSLPDAHKEIITEAARTAEVSVRDRVAQIEADAFAAAEENGMTVYQPTEDEVERWRKASQPVIDRWLEESGDLARTVYDAALSLRD